MPIKDHNLRQVNLVTDAMAQSLGFGEAPAIVPQQPPATKDPLEVVVETVPETVPIAFEVKVEEEQPQKGMTVDLKTACDKIGKFTESSSDSCSTSDSEDDSSASESNRDVKTIP